MRRVPSTVAQRALNAFRRAKILNLGAVTELIHSSVHTARRRLKAWKAHHSYNQNGRYYSLPDVPEFDDRGLWRWRGAFFSRYGNLKQTVIELVRRSEAGLDATEMRAILRLEPRSFLSAFANHPQLRREKTQGRFVYYAADPALGARQQQHRGAMSARVKLPTEFESVSILVEQIKQPAASVEELSRRLKRQKLSVAPQTIQNLFARYGLRVKKTPHSA